MTFDTGKLRESIFTILALNRLPIRGLPRNAYYYGDVPHDLMEYDALLKMTPPEWMPHEEDDE